MKTTEIIQRLMAHPDAETLLAKLEDRIAEDGATPDATSILNAYASGDVEAMFAAFTGWGMREFLAITCITPDTTNLLGLPKEYALFQDVDSVETPKFGVPVKLRVFLDDTQVSRAFVKGGTPVEMEVVQTYIDLYERCEPDNAGRDEKMEDYLCATVEDDDWQEFQTDANDCSDWEIRTKKTFHIRCAAHPGVGIGYHSGIDCGKFCITDLTKMTVAKYNNGYPEPVFDLVAASAMHLRRAGEIVVKPQFDTGLGFSSSDAILALQNAGILVYTGRTVSDDDQDYVAYRVNPHAAANHLHEDKEKALHELARRLDKFAEDCNPYEYADTVEDKAAHIQSLLKNLKSGELADIIYGTAVMVSENQDRTTIVEEGRELLRRLQKLAEEGA